jgi:hypothetical protein
VKTTWKVSKVGVKRLLNQCGPVRGRPHNVLQSVCQAIRNPRKKIEFLFSDRESMVNFIKMVNKLTAKANRKKGKAVE